MLVEMNICVHISHDFELAEAIDGESYIYINYILATLSVREFDASQ